MKKILSLFLLLSLTIATTSVAFAQGGNPPIPDPPVNSVVLDTLDWLTPAQEEEINTTVIALDEEGLAQIAVVTLDDCGLDAQLFRNDLFREWGIGHADDNDGLLIMVCWYGGVKGQRSVEQEVGNGLEGTIPDLLTDRVFNTYFVPAFSQGKPDSEVISSGEAGEALVAMVAAYDDTLRQAAAQVTTPDNTGTSDTGSLSTLLVGILIIAVIAGILSLGGAFGGKSEPEVEPDLEDFEPERLTYRRRSYVGGGGHSSRASSSRRSRREEDSDDDDDDDSSGGFSSGGLGLGSHSSGLDSNSGFGGFSGGTSSGGGSSGKF